MSEKGLMSNRLASCSCGQLTAKVAVEPVRVSICHCLACQRRTGSVFGQQARFRREHVSLSGVSSEYVRVGDEGDFSGDILVRVPGYFIVRTLTGSNDIDPDGFGVL